MPLVNARGKLQFVVRRLKIVILGLVIVSLVIVLVFFLVGVFKEETAGIHIQTLPDSSVFIDGVQQGRTPYKETIRPGEVVIKLVPESFEKPLAPYETKINLISGVETVISWEFGESDEEGGGEIVSFEKANRGETSLSVVTIPDSAQVVIDGTVKTFAPYKTSSIIPGEHILVVSAQGYLDRSVRVKTYEGFKLTAAVKLAPSKEPPEEEEPSSTGLPAGEAEAPEGEEEEKVWVEILSTPTGFLRVRAEPSTLGEEVARVEPGEKYLFIERDEKTGWFKIEYEEGKEGWVSNTYAKKIEEEEGASPTPTTTSTPTFTPTKKITPTTTPE